MMHVRTDLLGIALLSLTTAGACFAQSAPGGAGAAEREAAAKARIDSGKLMGTTVATVGGVPISLRELQEVVWNWKRTYLPKGEVLPPDQLNDLTQNLLESLIDRQLYIQEAKRRFLKSDKQRQMFDDLALKEWKQREIPRLIQKHKVANEYELRDKIEAQGGSLELMRRTFSEEMMAREFVQSRLKARMVEPSQPEFVAYYHEHLQDFHQPARVVWREIVVKVPPGASRAEAKRKAEEMLGRLARGADFEAMARAESQGPTAARGGLWQTEPNASSVPAVNAALASVPLNSISPVLEGPASFHIVRVESRTEAGPLPFDDEKGIVQRKIRQKLQETAFQRELEAFTSQLRSQTVITYLYGPPPKPAARRDPKAIRTSARGR